MIRNTERCDIYSQSLESWYLVFWITECRKHRARKHGPNTARMVFTGGFESSRVNTSKKLLNFRRSCR